MLSCLSNSIPPTNHNRRRKKGHQPNPREMEVQDHILDLVINPLKSRTFSRVSNVVDVARAMLHNGPITNLLDFEIYIIGLVKVCFEMLPSCPFCIDTN